jgi:chondroitin AC lyase
VATTVNQCLLKGDVIVNTGSQNTILKKGEHQLENAKWIFHDGVGYLFPKPVEINLSNQEQSGSWFDINKQSDSPKEEVKTDVFKLWIDHGNRLSNGSYDYIVVPAVTEQEMSSAVGRDVEILANSSEIQAVKHTGLQIYQAVFYKAGELQLSNNLKIICDNPGIVMIKMDGDKVTEVSVADPNRELGRFHLSISAKTDKNGEGFNTSWNEKEGLTHISVKLPQEVYAGKSVTVKL